MSDADPAPVTAAEADARLRRFQDDPALIIAVSGGTDSTALLMLAARWRASRATGPQLLAVTIDHGLRAESAEEAAAVARLSHRLGVGHRTLRWTGPKPKTGIQEKARAARYGLLAQAAREVGASRVLTAHTLDDQAETVLFRLARGSGLAGLAAMDQDVAIGDVIVSRPLLDLPKVRLAATLAAERIGHSEDPSNDDPRFARPRWRGLMPALAAEGLDARTLAQFAARARRADAALEWAVDAAAARLSQPGRAMQWSKAGPIVIDAAGFAALPAEIATRLLGRAIAAKGHEGPPGLGQLERFSAALQQAAGAERGAVRFRRTLAGALLTLAGDHLLVEPAPPRRAGTRPAAGAVAAVSKGR